MKELSKNYLKDAFIMHFLYLDPNPPTPIYFRHQGVFQSSCQKQITGNRYFFDLMTL